MQYELYRQPHMCEYKEVPSGQKNTLSALYVLQLITPTTYTSCY